MYIFEIDYQINYVLLKETFLQSGDCMKQKVISCDLSIPHSPINSTGFLK